MHRTADDHREYSDKRACPERDRDLRNRVNAPVQEGNVDQSDDSNERDDAGSSKSFPDVSRVRSEADITGCNFERTAQHELPDEEKRHQASQPLASECFA